MVEREGMGGKERNKRKSKNNTQREKQLKITQKK